MFARKWLRNCVLVPSSVKAQKRCQMFAGSRDTAATAFGDTTHHAGVTVTSRIPPEELRPQLFPATVQTKTHSPPNRLWLLLLTCWGISRWMFWFWQCCSLLRFSNPGIFLSGMNSHCWTTKHQSYSSKEIFHLPFIKLFRLLIHDFSF